MENANYEKSEAVKIDGESIRGYKSGTLHAVIQDSGIMEEVILGGIKTHDMELCRDMLINIKCFKQGDILINDRGFISMDMINFLKSVRGVDTKIQLVKDLGGMWPTLGNFYSESLRTL